MLIQAWQKLAVLEVNYLKWKCLKRKKCNDCWWPNKMKLLLMATLWCGGQAHLSPKSKCIFWVIHQLSNSPTPFHIEANNALWPSQKYELRKSILRRRNFSYHFRCLSHEKRHFQLTNKCQPVGIRVAKSQCNDQHLYIFCLYYMGGGLFRNPQKWLRNLCTTAYCVRLVVLLWEVGGVIVGD